jgi:hypothetical protein
MVHPKAGKNAQQSGPQATAAADAQPAGPSNGAQPMEVENPGQATAAQATVPGAGAATAAASEEDSPSPQPGASSKVSKRELVARLQQLEAFCLHMQAQRGIAYGQAYGLGHTRNESLLATSKGPSYEDLTNAAASVLPTGTNPSLEADNSAIMAMKLTPIQWVAFLQAVQAFNLAKLLKELALSQEKPGGKPLLEVDHLIQLGTLVRAMCKNLPRVMYFILDRLEEAEKGQLHIVRLINQLNQLIVKYPDTFAQAPPTLPLEVIRDRKANRVGEERARAKAAQDNIDWEEDFTESARIKAIRAQVELISEEELNNLPTLPEDEHIPDEDVPPQVRNAPGETSGRGGDVTITKVVKRVTPAPHTNLGKYNLPAPAKFSGVLDKNVACARTWLQLLQEYLQQHEQNFVERFPYHLEGASQKWAASLYKTLQAKGDLNATNVCKEFLLAYGDMLRSEEIKARDKLHSREYAMKRGDTYAHYVQGFKQLMREAGDMAEVDQIHWFTEGLTQKLKQACIVQPNGKPWVALDDLIEYGVGQEVKHNISTDVPPAPALAAMQTDASRGRRHDYGGSNGRGRGGNKTTKGSDWQKAKGKKHKRSNDGGSGKPSKKKAEGSSFLQGVPCTFCKQPMPEGLWAHVLKCPMAHKANK